MNTARVKHAKYDMEKVMISVGMFLMECFGIVMFFCGVFDIKIL